MHNCCIMQMSSPILGVLLISHLYLCQEILAHLIHKEEKEPAKQCPCCEKGRNDLLWQSTADRRPFSIGKKEFFMAKKSATKKEPSSAPVTHVPIKVITVNRQAFHDYEVERTVEAGIALVGTEIKSIREGRVVLRNAYAIARKGEIWLENAHIAPYEHGNRYNHEPMRTRKLLLHRREIEQIISRVMTKGLTLIPLKLYLKRGKAK